jgi:hypothetical protein
LSYFTRKGPEKVRATDFVAEGMKKVNLTSQESNYWDKFPPAKYDQDLPKDQKIID